MTESNLPIILFHYHYSPYARRVQWYLTLRGIPHMQCMQPPILPRPDLAALGIKYRRIPLLSIGRNVYLDTRLIIRKLEALHLIDSPSLGTTASSSPEHRALEYLLSTMMIDGGIFARAAQLIPSDLPLLRDPAFRKDRADLNNGRDMFSAQIRPEAINEIKLAASFLENDLLVDGRKWVLGGDKPTLADIEAVWPFHWLTTMPGALPEDQVSARGFPRVFAWVERFKGAVKEAKGKAPAVGTLKGEEALRKIVEAGYNDKDTEVDGTDAWVQAEGLKAGELVTVWPLDSGSLHKDVGKLVGINSQEVVIETEAAGGDSVRVHAPRHGFRVARHSESKPNL